MIADEVLERIYLELEQSFQRGRVPDAAEVARRHEVPRELIEDLCVALEVMGPAAAGSDASREAWAPPRLPAAPPALEDYEVLGELARGGMGVVYRARHRELGREVALKVLPRGAGPRALERFRREVEAVARLRHAHVVTVHSAGAEGGHPYFVMELVAGARPLDEAAAELAPRERVALVRDAARALGYAHRQGVIHRDVKPSNLLVDGEGALRVSDFGLTRGPDAEPLTQTGAVLGTLGYMAPEQAFGRGAAQGPASDVWGLGVVLYELCAGQRPFADATPGLFLDALAQERRPPPLPGWPELDRVCQRALAFAPADRYPDADALADELERVLAGGAGAGSRGAGAGALGAAALLALLLVSSAAALSPRSGARQAPQASLASVATGAALSAAAGPSASPPGSALAERDRPAPLPTPLQVVRHAPKQRGQEVGVCFADAETLITVGLEEVRRWDLRRGRPAGRWKLGAKREGWPLRDLRHVGRLADGSWIVAGAQGVARFPAEAWSSGARPEPLWAVAAPQVTALALDPAGGEVACWLQGKGLRRLDARDGRARLQHPPAKIGRCRALAYLSGGHLVSAVYKLGSEGWQEDCEVRLWSPGQRAAVRAANLPPVYSAAYSPIRSLLALGLRSGLILFLDPQTLERRGAGPRDPLVADQGLFRDRAFPNRVAGLAFLRGGQALLATPGRGMRRAEKYPKLFDLVSGGVIPITAGQPLPTVSFARSPGDALVAFGYENGSARVFRLLGEAPWVGEPPR